MNSQLIFNDEIFKQDFPLEGAHLVAASAGTGKTYNIQNIYARLIMEKGWRVSEIQVMTFTDAATKELRERLRTVLADVQLRLEDQPCPGKDAEDTLRRNERADKLVAACQQKTQMQKKAAIGLALLEFDSAAISTIHGFCSRALGRYAFETHTTFAPEIEDNKDAELSRRTLDWWRKRAETTPADILPQLNLAILQNYVKKLGGKTDWKLVDCDEKTPNGFMLAQAAEIVEAYEHDRVNRQKQTYDDLLRSMRAALYNETYGKQFAKSLRNTFHAALIDEFQDTDPVQYDIFKMVFLADPSVPVYFVGDPKQAIYAFRGGDIFTYREAAQNIPAEKKYYLDTNFRSTPRLMDAVNAIFKDFNGGFTFGDSEIGYPLDIKATDKKALKVNGEDDPAPFRFIQVKGKAQLDKALAQEVVKTLEEYPDELSPRDLAILVSSNAHAKDIMSVLRQCNVPCVVQKPGNVFTKVSGGFGNTTYQASRMLREFLDVCQAMAKMGGDKQLRTALATSFFGWTPAELLALKEDEAGLAEWIGRFDEMNSIWLKRGLGAALAKMEEFGTRKGVGYRERLALLPDGERLLADCGQIIELSFAAVKQIGPSPEKLVSWLKDRIANGAEEVDSDTYARELESDNNAVRIMTMHVSKGLQFPVVFLADCTVDAWKIGENDAACYHDNGHLVFSTRHQEEAEEEERLEKLRLLYVAMTRAEQRTVAFYDEKVPEPLQKLMENAKKNGAGENVVGSPIQWIKDCPVSESLPRYVAAVPSVALIPPNKPVTFDMRPTRGSYSAISPSISMDELGDNTLEKDRDAGDKAVPPESGDGERLPVFRVRGGVAIGSCWHEVLEEIAFDADSDEIRKVAEDKLLAYGFDPTEDVGGKTVLDVTCNMVEKVLSQQITAPDGKVFTLRDVSWQERMSEQEFNFPSALSAEDTTALAEAIRKHWQDDSTKQDFLRALEGWERHIPKGFINGFIDLVFRHDGYFYVVDWKSNGLGWTPESFTEESVRREMASHGYFFQYLLYTAVLQRYLKDLPGFGYEWASHFGGIRYVFLRGVAVGRQAAVFADRPGEELLDEIGAVLGLEVK